MAKSAARSARIMRSLILLENVGLVLITLATVVAIRYGHARFPYTDD